MKKKNKASANINWLNHGLKVLWVGFAVLVTMAFLYVFAVKGDWFGLFGGMPSASNFTSLNSDFR